MELTDDQKKTLAALLRRMCRSLSDALEPEYGRMPIDATLTVGDTRISIFVDMSLPEEIEVNEQVGIKETFNIQSTKVH